MQLKVLIVSNSEQNLRNILDELNRGEYDVKYRRVETKTELTDSLDDGEWDIILFYCSPGFMEPAEVLEILKSRALDLPFIVLSDTISEKAIVSAMKAGAHGFLSRKNIKNRLIPVIKREMEEAALRAERRREEQLLVASEKKYRMLTENTSDIIWSMDLDFNITYVSPAVESQLGFTVEEHKNRGLGRMTPVSLLLAAKILKEQLELENDENADPDRTILFEIEEYNKDGEPVPEEVSATFIRDDHGNPIGIHGISRDIRKRKRAESTLSEREDLFRLYFENISEVIFSINRDLRLTAISPSIEKLLGFKSEDLVGKSIRDLDFIFPGSWPVIKKSAQRVLNGETLFDLEFKYRSADGPARYCAVTSSPVHEGDEVVQIISIARDITDRKIVEESLRESEEKFRRLSEAAEEGVVIHDGGIIVEANQAFAKMTGYEVSELIGKHASEMTDAKSLEIIRKNIDNEYEKLYEVTGIRKDGSKFICELVGKPYKYKDGKNLRVSVFRDITEKKVLEEQLRQAVKMEAVGQLAGGIAHDFNNLLTGILGYANYIGTIAEPGSNIQESAVVIEKTAERAAELTERLLGFARRGKYRVEPVDVHETVGEIVKLLRRTIDKSIEIKINLDATSSNIMGDPGQIQHALLNLAINSRDAMPDGGILSFHTEDAMLGEEFSGELLGMKPGRYLILSVTDTGSGIREEIKNRIFEPFFTTKQNDAGTGMGLAMVYGIVKNHDGNIMVYSEPGEGTSFTIYLPLTGKTPEQIPETNRAQFSKGAERIMIVDDEEVVRKVAVELLEYLGYDVVAFSGSKAAVEYYKEHSDKIDLVVVDMVMPDIDGRECFMALKSINPKVKAVLSTGYGIDGRAQEIIDEGMVGFIQKPYQLNSLGKMIREALAK